MTTADPTTRLITADELLAMGDIGRCELIYGEIVMMSPAGAGHSEIGMRIGGLLTQHAIEQDSGMVLGADGGYLVETNPDLVRAPDASFVRKSRVVGRSLEGFFKGAPDLAIEVVSPNDTHREVAEKVNMWLAHGTATVWVAEPKSMTITIHRTGQDPVRLSRNDEIRDEPLLPCLVIPLSKVFRIS
jgi:Uma2 family endonuclease